MRPIVHNVLSHLMINNRLLQLLFLSVCLFGSPAASSDNDAAVTDSPEPIQLSMVAETKTQDDLLQDEITPAEEIEGDVRHAESAGSSVTDATADSALEPKVTDEEMANLRQLFLQAEVAVKNDDNVNYFLLADQLKDYPLYPYLQYQWLTKHLAAESEVKQFLEQQSSSRYAGKLKHKWLYHLAKKAQWQTFLQFYSKTSDTSLICYYHRAQFKTGDKQSALKGAKELWVAGYSQPRACDPLFAQLEKSSLFNQALIWQRFDAALRNNKTSLAGYIKKFMSEADQKTAGLWLNLHRKPERYIPELLSRSEITQAPLMFAHAINRLAGSDIHQAIDLWDKNKHRFDISKKQSDSLEKRLASRLAYENESGAYERLGRLNEADESSKTSRIRVALNEQNWSRVITAIEDLDDTSRNQEKWQYWLARAYEETGRPLQADELLNELSSKRDFYGYLAADRLNRLYQLSDNPLDVSAQQIADIKNRREFRVAFELKVLERDTEAKLQWWHAIRQLNVQEITAAAKLAQQWQWDEVAIFTIAKVKLWDDIDLRFPLSYADKINENATELHLNPVILFGLVRRESAFNKDAHSPVGARGLMQLMPKTARQIAKDLNERWPGKDSLYNPVKNLKYGSYYYQKLLNQFDGNYALALAAYNAGPGRVKQWLPDESIPADIWIETIPFRETREYVTSVLVYAMIYQQRMQSSELTLNDLTSDVQPLQPNEFSMNDVAQSPQRKVMTP